MFRKSLGSPALFAVVWTSLASAIYFSLGVVAERAIGLTPLVFLGSAVFFVLTVMTYVEGASLHQERLRDGLRPLRLQRAGELRRRWAILLDFLILVASARSPRRTTWGRSGRRWARAGPRSARDRDRRVIAVGNIRGFGGAGCAIAMRFARHRAQLVVIVLGLRRLRRRADRYDPSGKSRPGRTAVRDDDQHRRVHGARLLVRHGGRGPGQPARPQAADRERDGLRDRHLRRHLARRGRGAAGRARRRAAARRRARRARARDRRVVPSALAVDRSSSTRPRRSRR